MPPGKLVSEVRHYIVNCTKCDSVKCLLMDVSCPLKHFLITHAICHTIFKDDPHELEKELTIVAIDNYEGKEPLLRTHHNSIQEYMRRMTIDAADMFTPIGLTEDSKSSNLFVTWGGGSTLVDKSREKRMVDLVNRYDAMRGMHRYDTKARNSLLSFVREDYDREKAMRLFQHELLPLDDDKPLEDGREYAILTQYEYCTPPLVLEVANSFARQVVAHPALTWGELKESMKLFYRNEAYKTLKKTFGGQTVDLHDDAILGSERVNCSNSSSRYAAELYARDDVEVSWLQYYNVCLSEMNDLEGAPPPGMTPPTHLLNPWKKKKLQVK